MYRIILSGLTGAVLLAASASATAEATTTAGAPACQEPHWLEAMLNYRAEGQTAAYERYINTGRCIELREGMPVEVRAYYGDSDNHRVEFLLNGYRFYAQREAVATAL